MSVTRKAPKRKISSLRLSASLPTVQEPDPPQALAPELDQFKFRLVARDGRHYFKAVKFDTPNLNAGERQQVLEFFEGRSLESITRKTLKAGLGALPSWTMLIALLDQMRQVVE